MDIYAGLPVDIASSIATRTRAGVQTMCPAAQIPDINIYAYYQTDHKKYDTII